MPEQKLTVETTTVKITIEQDNGEFYLFMESVFTEPRLIKTVKQGINAKILWNFLKINKKSFLPKKNRRRKYIA